MNVATKDMLKFFFSVTVGGVSWVLAGLQIKVVGTFFAVGYRLFLGSVFLICYALLSNRPRPNFNKQNVLSFITKSLLLFSINYALCYEGLKYISGGQISIVVSAMIVPNIIFGALILKEKITVVKLFSSSLAIIGLGIVFYEEILSFSMKDNDDAIGLMLVFSSIFVSALGTTLGGKFLKTKAIDNVWSIGISMGMGGLLTIIFGLIRNGKFIVTTDFDFILTLLFLAIITALSFIIYMGFVVKYGAEKSSYIWLLSPVSAVIASSIYEGLVIDKFIILGGIIILISGYLSTAKISLFQSKK